LLHHMRRSGEAGSPLGTLWRGSQQLTRELCEAGGFPLLDELIRDLRKLGLADKPDDNRSYLSDYNSDDDRDRGAPRGGGPRGGGGGSWGHRRGPDKGRGPGGSGGYGGGSGGLGPAPSGSGRHSGHKYTLTHTI
jgi:hypothetical protein